MKVLIDKNLGKITMDTELPKHLGTQVTTTHALCQLPVLIQVERNKRGDILRVTMQDMLSEGIKVTTPEKLNASKASKDS